MRKKTKSHQKKRRQERRKVTPHIEGGTSWGEGWDQDLTLAPDNYDEDGEPMLR